jgi:hypothetical protein
MKRHRGVLGLLASAAALAVAGVGCSLLVSGDVPDFQCAGTSASACPSGMTCSPGGHCVTSEASVDPVEAGDEDVIADGDVPEMRVDADAPSGPLDLGQKCRVDADCKSRLCASSTVLTTVITASTGPICTTPCCTSSECTSGFVCFNGGTGGGYCVPSMLAQRTPPATGGKLGGSACAGNSDCRSGLCAGTPNVCVDTCCVEGNCFGSSTCRVATVSAPAPAHDIWVCAPPAPGGSKLPGDSCVNSTDCLSQDCVGTSGGRICRPSCESTASCHLVTGFETGHCLYGPSGSDYLKFCFAGTLGTDSPAGAACTDNSTCQSDYCDAELKKCANVCGRDADCLSNESCRPSATGTPFLRCVPKP